MHIKKSSGIQHTPRIFKYLVFSIFSKLKTELAMLKKKGLLRSNGQFLPSHQGHPPYYNPVQNISNQKTQQLHMQQNQHNAGNVGGVVLSQVWPTAYQDPARSCGRCRSELGRIMNRGAFCRSCKVRVCKSCREYGRLKGGGSSNHDWLCTVCHKSM